jgi:hypothetical protein
MIINLKAKRDLENHWMCNVRKFAEYTSVNKEEYFATSGVAIIVVKTVLQWEA